MPGARGQAGEAAEGQDRCRGGSEGGDVVQSVVQLLTDGLELHLLSIDFVCRCAGKGMWGGVQAKQSSSVEGGRERRRE